MEKSMTDVVSPDCRGVTAEELRESLEKLEREGCTLRDIQVENRKTGKMTATRVLARPGAER